MINQYRRYYYEVQYQIKVDAKVNDSGNYFFHSQDELKEADFITNIASYLKTTNDGWSHERVKVCSSNIPPLSCHLSCDKA